MSKATKAFLKGAAIVCLLGLTLWALLSPGGRLAAPPLSRVMEAYPWVRSTSDGHLRLDVDAFVRSQNARDFRDAQLKYFARKRFDLSRFRYSSETPGPESWGPLPYPPLRQAEPDSAAIPLEQSFLGDVAYQTELDRLTGSELVVNSELRMYQDGSAFEPMKALVEHARKYLYLEMLSISCDASTEPVISAIEAQARRGVDVRAIVHKHYALLSRSCLNRLRRAGVQVAKGLTHASYLLNDQGELLIGSESLAWMFAKSTGTNALDRDVMVYLKGPTSTDALRGFLGMWEDNRASSDRGILEGIRAYQAKTAEETAAGKRGAQSYARWVSAGTRGLCRYSADPSLLQSLAAHARSNVTLSGVKVGTLPALDTVLTRSARSEIEAEFFGNGWEGGNGELTMLLDDWIQSNQSSGRSRLAKGLELIRDLDMKGQARRRFASYERLMRQGSLTIWGYFNFLHYKIWSFDRVGAWIGSANPDSDAFAQFHDAGVFCMDDSLMSDLARQQSRDRANSVPFSTRVVTR